MNPFSGVKHNLWNKEFFNNDPMIIICVFNDYIYHIASIVKLCKK